jgi:putative transposase
MKRMASKDYGFNQDAAASRLFSPQHGDDQQTAAAQVQAHLYRSPLDFGLTQSRWRLDGIRQVIPWLTDRTLPCIHKMLKRFHVSYKRGQLSLHSPDRAYDRKIALIRQARTHADSDPLHIIFLYEDEHLIGRYPTVARAYASTGARPLKAEQYAGYNGMLRIAGCLDAHSGAVISHRYGSIDIPTFIKFLAFVEQQYPDAKTIYMALDNWTVHVSAEVQASLKVRASKITLLFLPTYAPWTNPMEKVWLRFQQEVAHLHPHWFLWKPWRERIDRWLGSVRQGNQRILQATGVRSLSYLKYPSEYLTLNC